MVKRWNWTTFMETTAATFLRLAGEITHAAKISFPLAELNDLLTAAGGEEIEQLPAPSISDPYRLNYVTAMVEMAAHRAVVPPLWTSAVEPLGTPVFIDPSLNL